jgi:hypothetical protein
MLTLILPSPLSPSVSAWSNDGTSRFSALLEIAKDAPEVLGQRHLGNEIMETYQRVLFNWHCKVRGRKGRDRERERERERKRGEGGAALCMCTVGIITIA